MRLCAWEGRGKKKKVLISPHFHYGLGASERTLTVCLSLNKEVIPVNEKVRLTNITDAPGKSRQTLSRRRTHTHSRGGASDAYYLRRPLSGFKRCALVNF